MSLEQAIEAVSEFVESREKVITKESSNVVIFPHQPTPSELATVKRLLTSSREGQR
jgi:hypothetical protein